MNPIQSAALGVIQGLTEFLPVSSSGHLVVLQHFFGLTEPELLFDVCLHVATLAAVIAVFRRDISRILGRIVRLPQLLQTASPVQLWRQDPEIRMAGLIVVGNLPTAVIGLFFSRAVDLLFGTVSLAGVMLMVTGTFLWLTRRLAVSGRPPARMTARDAVIIGAVQGLAILPGISRSGATITAALFLGVNRETSGRFSFLLSIPAIVGALLLSLKSHPPAQAHAWEVFAIGAGAAGAVGYMALIVLLRVVKKGQLFRFAPYCWLVGIAVLTARFMGW